MSRPVTLYRSLWWAVSVLTVLTLWMTACAPASTPSPVLIERTDITPTPFQPQTSAPDSPFSLPVDAPPVETITPVSPAIVKGDGVIPARVVPPTPDSSQSVYEINPLTGLPFPDPALAERRPIAVKIGNSPDYVRPQSGLTLTDVAFEYYIEWGDTRFIGVFYSNDAKKVGPIRSGRFFDEHVLRMYHAFLVYKYSDPREKAYFYSSDFAPYLTVPGYIGLNNCPPFFYAPAKDSYNNIFFDTSRMAACAAKHKGVDNLRQDLRNGFFSEKIPENGQLGTRIFTDYSVYNYNYWEYDPATHRYFRYQEANDMVKDQPRAYAPMYDAATGQQVNADNIIVIFVPTSFTNQYDEEDQVYHIDPVDNGLAYVFRDGQAYPARWYRTDMDQPLFIADENGVPIYLRPGRTFYEVIGESSQQAQNDSDWYFTFHIP